MPSRGTCQLQALCPVQAAGFPCPVPSVQLEHPQDMKAWWVSVEPWISWDSCWVSSETESFPNAERCSSVGHPQPPSQDWPRNQQLSNLVCLHESQGVVLSQSWGQTLQSISPLTSHAAACLGVPEAALNPPFSVTSNQTNQ